MPFFTILKILFWKLFVTIYHVIHLYTLYLVVYLENLCEIKYFSFEINLYSMNYFLKIVPGNWQGMSPSIIPGITLT